MDKQQKRLESIAESFRRDEPFEKLLASGKGQAELVGQLPLSERLRFGHYIESRAAWVAVNGQQPKPEVKTEMLTLVSKR